MKIKFLRCLILIFAFSFTVSAQNVTITPKKTVYTRSGKNVPKEKKTFVVTFPVISGTISPSVKKKLEDTTSYWKTFNTSVAQNLGDFWLSELSYQVNYNKNGILDIALTQSGVGAYPDSQTIEKVINLKTGEPIKFKDVFKFNSLAKLAQMVDEKLDVEKKAIIRRVDKGEFDDGANDKELRNSLKEQINALRFTADNFDEFSVGDKGVTIFYDAGFPHVIQAAQPNGRYFFNWERLKPFIRREGLLGRFVR